MENVFISNDCDRFLSDDEVVVSGDDEIEVKEDKRAWRAL
jgi:hypothetical protein